MSARRDVAFVMNEYKFSERRACRLLDIERASYRYEARPDRNEKLREALVVEARQNPRLRLSAALGRADKATRLSGGCGNESTGCIGRKVWRCGG